MISKKTKYGLKAMLALAKGQGNTPVLISDLAEKERMPKKFLEQILLELKNKGILHSKKGKGGGYFLARAPKAITFGEIVRALEGTLAPVSCASQTCYKPCEDCHDEDICAVKMVMKEVRDEVSRVLDHTTLQDAINRMNDKVQKQKSVLSFSI